ncbi:MAG: endonuclease/exonuclease/phosphatase family protein [Cyclobacteriaceae bacterium]|nr:endonuclease/exonuclease/phosphatase family protein [Cyclobacteriaceae bacterium]
MFYNTENLFDTFDDPAINDDEYTPEGALHWSFTRYRKKLNNIARVITAVGEWQHPDLIGLCEVENFQVLMDLTTQTPLKNAGYRIIHENSPDRRGIDVAMLYKPEKIALISQKLLPVGDGTTWNSRDMLLCMFGLEKDTLFVIACHWPSRSGGAAASAPRRDAAARILRQAVDSLQRIYNEPKIMMMGDFNDEPVDNSLAAVLRAVKYANNPAPNQLFNLSFDDLEAGRGTLVHTEINKTWYAFDQIIVSGALLTNNKLSVKPPKTLIYQQDWLIQNGRPFRTYQGPRYLGGFSDHLPICIDLQIIP